MKIILQQTIIIGALLFGATAQASGFATAGGGSEPGRKAAICMGVNGSGQPADTRQERCDADGKGIHQPTLRGRLS
jgi:hypothetical protein